MKISDLSRHGVPRRLVSALREAGYDTLYPPQAEAVRAGALRGGNLLLALPTAAGKTLIAELCMLRSVLEEGGQCLYVVPLRALAAEKYEEFKRRYEPLGVSVGVATGEYDSPGTRLSSYRILVATSEKVDSLLRMRARWLGESLTVAVMDEVHYIHDPSRGPTLEFVIARLRQVNPALRILALSATVRNARELASWLDAALVSSDWRPVPLLEGVYAGDTIYYADRTTRSLVAERANPARSLVTDTVDAGGQALVFVNSRRSAQAAARALAPHLRGRLKDEERTALREVADAAGVVLQEPTRLCGELAGAIRCGVAFHHAGLHQEQRRLVEGAFRARLLKAICATPTLAAGVNLPARRVVIRDWGRYESGLGQRPIPVFEYKQFAGRAGRPGYDEEGEAILVAKRERDLADLFERYIRADAEPLRSRLGEGGALPAHILASIAAGYAASMAGIMEFLSLTFFAAQGDVRTLELETGRILDFLIEEGLIAAPGRAAGSPLAPGDGLVATTFGAVVSRLYLQPESGLILRRGLEHAAARPAVSSGALLHLACCCPDMPLLNLTRGDRAALEDAARAGDDAFLIPPPSGGGLDEYERFLKGIRTAGMLGDWIDEAREEEICDRYGIGPGDVRRFVENADWLVYAAGRLASALRIEGVQPALRDLRRRVLYGIREELLDLVSLKGIGRVRARHLFRAGYRTLDAPGKAREKDLAAVPSIGP
ncbi:MAG: DEAD/DEAH box helicase, partial [bacterium]|nr:DEAD/DEAH box helicase [bacterium]